ncbi:Na(+)/H(+) antiporter subunit C [Arcanobacterium pinnipediorum]|uniref:Na(+)/H(+) antiporter subunit C n=1 Tax=Arcanobacterium pinnipediorum TaxID=1503041 RepID=A0ABY5AHH0_9ACTO|nr:Na(+)/H(+) antiporter subunit C [Arcanobacterium pinnipediorum]USR79537.1 Na(+)/H(+) antiporter subunit C [Arcanobacterium pinnipediorum]
MTSSAVLILLAGVLMAVGVYLVTERSLSRIVVGLASITNSVNILFLIAGGPSGQPPIVGQAEPHQMADPLVQAMMLTAIVLSLGLTAFLLAVGYRSWQLYGNDEVQDDLEDKRLAKHSEAVKIAERADKPQRIEDDAEEARDETESRSENESEAHMSQQETSEAKH